MGLFNIFKRKPKKYRPVVVPESQKCLTTEGELPWGWPYANKDFMERIETEYKFFLNSWIESRKQPPRLEYAALKSFVQYMNDTKRLCKSKGECYEFWLTSCFDDDYLNVRTAELKKMGQNLSALETAYQKKQSFEKNVLPTLESELLKIIREQPGVMQKDVYKMFPAEAKSYVQEKLYFADKNGIITREKCGNTYRLFAK